MIPKEIPSIKESPRGHRFVYQRGKPNVITVEMYEKWYELWVTQPDGSYKALSFLDLEDGFHGTPYRDHDPNPSAVDAYAERTGATVDELSMELMTGRWVRGKLVAEEHYLLVPFLKRRPCNAFMGKSFIRCALHAGHEDAHANEDGHLRWPNEASPKGSEGFFCHEDPSVEGNSPDAMLRETTKK